MNAIQYGFHRLYLRYSSDEEYQIEAIARIVGREKDALDKLAVELALAESSIHLANIPAEPSARAPKTTKKRASHGRAQKSSQAKYDKEGMIAAVQSGEVTADRVIENIKKRGVLKEKRKSSGAKPRKKRREWSIFKCMNLMKMMKRKRKRKRRQVMIGIRERRKLLQPQSCPNLPILEESIAIPMKIKKSMKQHHHRRR